MGLDWFKRNCTALSSCEALLHIQNRDINPLFIVVAITEGCIIPLTSEELYYRVCEQQCDYYIVAADRLHESRSDGC